MRCVKCQSENVRIIDSRMGDGNSIRRRRWCEDCGKRFSTIEITWDEFATLKGKESSLNGLLRIIKEEIDFDYGAED